MDICNFDENSISKIKPESDSSFAIPKSTSLNFELYANSIQKNKILDQNSKEDEIISLKFELSKAKAEISKLNRKNDTLKFEIDVNEDKTNRLIGQMNQKINNWKERYSDVQTMNLMYKEEAKRLNEDIKKLQDMAREKDEIIQKSREDFANAKKTETKKLNAMKIQNNELKKKNNEIRSRLDSLTFKERMILETDEKISSLVENYEKCKESLMNQDEINNNKMNINSRLEKLCEFTDPLLLLIKKLENENMLIANKLEEKEEINKGYVINLSTVVIEKKRLEKTLQEKNEYIDSINKLSEKLQVYENANSIESSKLLKRIFNVFNECLCFLKEIATTFIQKDDRSPFLSTLMKESQFFTDVNEISSVFKVLDSDFLSIKKNEMEELKQCLYLLKIDLGHRDY